LNLHVVILAAGKGTRMKSSLPKVLHRVAGIPMIDYVLDAAAQLQPQSTTLVIGHKAEEVRTALGEQKGLTFVVQEPQSGTAHALRTAEPALAKATGTLVLLSGDVPLLTAASLGTLVDRHKSTRAAATVVTSVVDNPAGYGRIVRSGERIARIVEDKDASPAEREIREINAGIYAFTLDGSENVFSALGQVADDNEQHEFYLPDRVAIFRARGSTVETVRLQRSQEILGINSRAELAAVSRIVRDTKNQELMAAGVTIEDPATTYIGRDVTIGVDTIIHPCVHLEGSTTIGEGCEIHSGTRIVNAQIGNRVVILNNCVITEVTVSDAAQIGPFSHVHKGTRIGPQVKIGNFVEVKNTQIGARTKSSHLTYLGDSFIGEGVNIGAGTITCNYDGEKKHPTTIEDGAFIGSDTQLIAPVTVGKNAYVGTGTTVRENVPSGALAVSAGKQRNIEGWVEKKKKTRN